MKEIVFPLFGTAFVVLVVLPAFALLTKGILILLERDNAGGPLHGLTIRYVLIVGATALPLAWFLSAGLHQAETGQAAAAAVTCLFDHDTAALCFEPGLFALALLAVSAVGAAAVARRLGAPRDSGSSAEGSATAARLERVLGERSTLASLRGRMSVTDEVGFAIGTHGFVRPRVVVGSSFAAGLSDDMLASALGHESEHVLAYDPLRYFVLEWALALNPFGRPLLEPHAVGWRAAREAHCDREAVILGAAPLALADAIVRAARPGPRPAVALGTRDASILKFRVEMLFAFAERAPVRCCHRGPSAFPVALVLLIVTLLLPHGTSTAALDALHSGAESALANLVN